MRGASPIGIAVRDRRSHYCAAVGIKLARWEAATDVPLIVAAVLFLFAFALPILWWPTPPQLALICEVVVWCTWAVFACDFVVRVCLAHDRLRYALRHWFDLIVILLPALRPLRLLRLVTVLSVLNRRASTSLRGRVTTYVISAALMLTMVGALAVLDAERGTPDANILTFGDALWWSVSTMTTAGYGDLYPVTALGRSVAVGLMICGIAILGTVTASLASWFIERVDEGDRDTKRLIKEVEALRAELRALPRRPPGEDSD